MSAFYAYLPWYLFGLAAWLGALTYLIFFRYPRRLYFNGILLRPDRHWVEHDYYWSRGKPHFHFEVKSTDTIELQLGFRRLWLNPDIFIEKMKDRPTLSRVEEKLADDFYTSPTQS